MIFELKFDFIVIVYLEALRQQFTIVTKNSLSSKFLLVAKLRIHFDKPKIHLSTFFTISQINKNLLEKERPFLS